MTTYLQPTEPDRRCGATITLGPKRSSGIVYGRRRCKAYPLKGYEHCRFHLTDDEHDRYLRERRES